MTERMVSLHWRPWPHEALAHVCPGWVKDDKPCSTTFTTRRGLEQHMRKTGHFAPFFRYAKHVSRESCTCTICGYVPVYNVDNPTKCLHDHMRRRHRLEWVRERKPYTIAEEP